MTSVLRSAAALGVLLLLASRAFAQEPGRIEVRITEDDEKTPRAAGHPKSNREAASSPLSGPLDSEISVGLSDCSRLGHSSQKPKKKEIWWECYCNQQLTQGCTLSFELQVDDFTGGHDHHDDHRPIGNFPTQGTTGPDGRFTAEYESPEVAGDVLLDATFVSGPCPVVAVGDVLIHVKGDDHWPLQPSGVYTLVGSYGGVGCSGGGISSKHYYNHNLTGAMVNRVSRLALKYYDETGDILKMNDGSLEVGGVFDINNNWLTPHISHRYGKDQDVCFPGGATAKERLENRTLLRSLATCSAAGLYPEASPNNYHFRQCPAPALSNPSTACPGPR